MIREVALSQCGILFDAAEMARFNIHTNLPPQTFFALPTPPRPLTLPAAQIRSPSPSEKDADSDRVDATKPLHDEFKLAPIWWLLEIIPLPFAWQEADGTWKSTWRFNLGRGRYVNKSGPLLFHETVRMRMEDAELKYTPQARYTKGQETYVW
jgi:hypothetical protein